MRLESDLADDLADATGAVLDRRLLPSSPRPIAVALSGGGDSLALLFAADAWRRRSGRELIVLTVDHGLRPESRAWTRTCAAIAERLTLPFRELRWQGPRPATGLPAAAREARHGLLAAAAREAGATVLLMGHTADDVLEARAMRAEGSTTPEPQAWAPSPVWPQGRGLFVLRPLLRRRRAEIRQWLNARGERWIDDPANEDPRSARARARLTTASQPAPDDGERPPLTLAAAVEEPVPGLLALPRAALRCASEADARRLLALMAVCAGGGDRTPASDSLARLASVFRTEASATLSLAGARLEAEGETVRALREAGEAKRGGLVSLALEPGEPAVWDGRFEMEAVRPGLTIHALSGRLNRLPQDQRGALNAIAANARPGLPVALDSRGVSCPILSPRRDLLVRPLVLGRLQAAAGLVEREPA